MASTPLEHTSKTGSDHAHFVVRAATACHAFSVPDSSIALSLHQSKGKQLLSPENLQPITYHPQSGWFEMPP